MTLAGVNLGPIRPLAVLLAACLLFAARGVAAEDGRRAVEVPQWGVAVRAPLAWTLIEWGREDRAFILRLPQERPGTPGSVTCRLELVAGSLADWRKQQSSLAAAAPPPDPQPTMLADALEPIEAARFAGLTKQDVRERWERLSEVAGPGGRKTFELEWHLLHGGLAYAFVLRTDEEHFDAYRADFEDLCASARFSEPTRGAGPLGQGFWLQRDFGFALRLPEGFEPSFAPRGKTALAAARPAGEKLGAAELALMVSAGPRWELDVLRTRLPDEIRAADADAQVDRCQIVPQGQERALETIVRTMRDKQPIVIFARRFRGRERNYELRITAPAGEADAGLEAWRRRPTVFARSSRRRPRARSDAPGAQAINRAPGCGDRPPIAAGRPAAG